MFSTLIVKYMLSAGILYVGWVKKLGGWEYSQSCLKQPFEGRPKLVFKADYGLMHVKSIAEWSIPQCFRSALSYHRSVFMTLFLSIFGWPLKTGFTVYNVVFKNILVEKNNEHCKLIF